MKLFLTLLFAVSFIFLGLTQTVPPSVQALLGCQSNVPFLSVDFTGNPVGSTTVTGQSRNGFCCSASGSDKCMVVEFTLDPSVVGELNYMNLQKEPIVHLLGMANIMVMRYLLVHTIIL